MYALQISVEVMSVWSDDDDVDKAGPGENVKLKLKNVEEEDVSPGFVLCSPDDLCHTGKIFDAQVCFIAPKYEVCTVFTLLHYWF